MSKDWKMQKEKQYYSKNLNNDRIEREIKREQKEAMHALASQWRYRIKKLHEKGYSATEIYKLYALVMKQQLGFDPQKTIEYFTGETITKNQEKSERQFMDDMDI